MPYSPRVPDSTATDITGILRQAQQGDAGAPARLMEMVYTELRGMAAQRMAKEAPGQTLQATALVHEAWLKLGGDKQAAWQNRAHFFAAAAEAMRRILIDRARRKRAARHGGGQQAVDVQEIEIAAPQPDDELLAVNEALERFAQIEPRKAELVKLRYFVGLNLEEAADALGIAHPTAKRWWAFSRAWLFDAIEQARKGVGPR